MYYLGLMYSQGYGVMIDYHVSLGWFQKAALKNDPSISERSLEAAVELKTFLEQVTSKVDALGFTDKTTLL